MRQYKDYAFNNLLKKNINAFAADITSKYISIFTNDLNVIEAGFLLSLVTNLRLGAYYSIKGLITV